MGNCTMKSGVTGECHHSIRVLTDSGAVLQFKGPKTVGQVIQHYPGYGLFRQGHASSPLPVQETLSYSLFYYLLPLEEVSEQVQGKGLLGGSEAEKAEYMGEDHVPACDYVQNLSNGSALEVLPSARNGVWKVKLVIETQQLEEILSKQVNTEALIEKMRMAATTCSTTSPTRSRTMINSWKMGRKNAFWAKRNAAEANLGSC